MKGEVLNRMLGVMGWEYFFPCRLIGSGLIKMIQSFRLFNWF